MAIKSHNRTGISENFKPGHGPRRQTLVDNQEDRDKSLRIRDLMGLRLIQCRQAV